MRSRGRVRNMNAVLREDEVAVILNETVESRLARVEVVVKDVRASQDGLHARIDKTNKRLDRTNGKLDELNKSLGDRIDKTNHRIDDVNKNLGAKIDGANNSLGGRVDEANKSLGARIDTFNESLGARIDRMSDKIDNLSAEIKGLVQIVSSIHTTAKVVLAIVGLCVSFAVIVNALKTLRWI